MIDKDALTKACEAFADAEIGAGRLPKFHEDSIAAAILAYESAKEAKRKPAEEVAKEIAIAITDLKPPFKPSIEQLEHAIMQPDNRYFINIRPDGSVNAIDNEAVTLIAAAIKADRERRG